MREFNTSGPNIPEQHYTIIRHKLIQKGIELVDKSRYFTIWAPRQTGKSTYFRQLADELDKIGYKVAHINFENYRNEPLSSFLYRFNGKIKEFWGLDFSHETNISKILNLLEEKKDEKFVLIIDEVEGINKEYFGSFLHSIRNAYHSRDNHCLKSVILVGVSNIVGVVSDNASPFNIADNLEIPYFTNNEVIELIGQHEKETGQLFEKNVVEKISDITANQPGLVNGFARKLVEDCFEQKTITYKNYLKAEHWYLNLTIDKNIANILNKATKHRSFVERLLFTQDKIPFKINKPHIKELHTNGLIKEDSEGMVCFWVPLYRKTVYDAFYPYMNGEQKEINLTYIPSDFYDAKNRFNIYSLIKNYKTYVKRRGFKPFMEKDEIGGYKNLKESALIYSFETFITAIIQEINGKIYREADTGLGKSDLIINIDNLEFLIETKVYSSINRFGNGKKQLAYYAHSLELKKAIYLVFLPQRARITETVKEQTEIINGIEIITSLIVYDDEKW